jgi:hypothetical protein
MTQDSDNIAAIPEAYRSWTLARAQELKRADPSRSKKDCWRGAQSEWHELRRQWKRKQREERRMRAGRPVRPMPFGVKLCCKRKLNRSATSVAIVPYRHESKEANPLLFYIRTLSPPGFA